MVVPLGNKFAEKVRDSRLADKFTLPAAWAESKLAPVFDEAIRKTLNRLTIEPGSEESVKLRFTVANPKVRPDLETKML